MSSNLIFRVPGRTQNYMPVDINSSKDEILEKYARASFSTANDWPQDSPNAGYYDIKNSDTKLILLNNHKKWSHLRGKTREKHETFKKDKNYDWVEKEIENKKNSSSESLNYSSFLNQSRKPDPDRHLIKSGCSYKYIDKEPCFQSESFLKLKRRNQSAVPVTSRKSIYANTIEKKEDEETENEILLRYLYAVGKRTTGLQGTGLNKRPPREFLSSYNINHPEFNKGQRLFLNELCSMYSVTPLKEWKKDQYIKLFQKQKQSDEKHRMKYRMHDGDNFDLYKNWLVSERPLPHEINCGYYKKLDRPISYKSTSKSLKSKSMINKPSSSLSTSSSFVSQSTLQKPQTAPTKNEFESKSMSVRPATAKKPLVIAKMTSSSDTSFVPSNRIESKDLIKKIKDVENNKKSSESSDPYSSSDNKHSDE